MKDKFRRSSSFFRANLIST